MREALEKKYRKGFWRYPQFDVLQQFHDVLQQFHAHLDYLALNPFFISQPHAKRKSQEEQKMMVHPWVQDSKNSQFQLFRPRNSVGISHGVALVSRLLEIKGLFCKKNLQKRRYSAKETYNFEEPIYRRHPISFLDRYMKCNSV